MYSLSADLALLTEERFKEEIYPEALQTINVNLSGIKPVNFRLEDTSMPLAERKMMASYFQKTKLFPELLVSHNDAIMQAAYTAVPQDLWHQRVTDLEIALQSTMHGDKGRREIVTRHPALEMPNWITQHLNVAFLRKYEQLLPRVKIDFENYFPYHVKSTSPKLMVFEKMSQVELVRYVLQQF